MEVAGLSAPTVTVFISSSLNSFRSEKRYSRGLTIAEFKCKLELVVGSPASCMELELYGADEKFCCKLDQEDALLGSYPIDNGCRIHVIDHSSARLGEYEDVSKVEKYRISQEAYDQRQDSVRSFLKRSKLGRYNEEEQAQREAETTQRFREEQEQASAIPVGSRCEVRVPGQPPHRGTVMYVDTSYLPTGLLWQEGPLEWLHLPSQRRKVIYPYHQAIATVIQKGRSRALELFGREPLHIVLPLRKDLVQRLFQNDEDWGTALAGFPGQLTYHLPKHPLLTFWTAHPFVFPKVCSPRPLTNASLAFTDGSSNGTAAWVIDNIPYVLQTGESSAQCVELAAVINVFEQLSNCRFNLYSDAQYIVSLFPHLETAVLPGPEASPVMPSLLCLYSCKQWQSLWLQQFRYHLEEIRAPQAPHGKARGPGPAGKAAARGDLSA